MAMLITEECINCAACEEECPNDSISEGDETYTIEAAKCTECVGHYDEPQCVEACPVDEAIVTDAKLGESKEQLLEKFKALQ